MFITATTRDNGFHAFDCFMHDERMISIISRTSLSLSLFPLHFDNLHGNKLSVKQVLAAQKLYITILGESNRGNK